MKVTNNPPTISHPIKIESRQLPQMGLDIFKMTAKPTTINLLTSEMKPNSVKHVLLENVLNPGANYKGTQGVDRTKPLTLARP